MPWTWKWDKCLILRNTEYSLCALVFMSHSYPEVTPPPQEPPPDQGNAGSVASLSPQWPKCIFRDWAWRLWVLELWLFCADQAFAKGLLSCAWPHTQCFYLLYSSSDHPQCHHRNDHQIETHTSGICLEAKNLSVLKSGTMSALLGDFKCTAPSQKVLVAFYQ